MRATREERTVIKEKPQAMGLRFHILCFQHFALWAG
jgi:hypothetical protein